MTLQRLQQLVRQAVYEPDRGLPEAEAPPPFCGEVRDVRVRVNGHRLFLATDEHGELCGIGTLSPGGDIETIAIGLHARIAGSSELLLRAI